MFCECFLMLVFVSGACEEDPGAHRDVSGGERPCFLQHRHHQALRRGPSDHILNQHLKHNSISIQKDTFEFICIALFTIQSLQCSFTGN